MFLAISEAVPGVFRDPYALDAYTPAIRQLYAMNLLSNEVDNGGFSQFFYNGGGVWLDDAIAGFEAAGLDGHRRVTIDAAEAVVPILATLTAAQQRASTTAYGEWAEQAGLDELDDRWYALSDIDTACERYMADHAAAIWEAG
jgi:hypothetical protein